MWLKVAHHLRARAPPAQGGSLLPNPGLRECSPESSSLSSSSSSSNPRQGERPRVRRRRRARTAGRRNRGQPQGERPPASCRLLSWHLPPPPLQRQYPPKIGTRKFSSGLSESGDPGVSRVISGGHIRTCGEPCSAHKGWCQAALALAWAGGLAVRSRSSIQSVVGSLMPASSAAVLPLRVLPRPNARSHSRLHTGPAAAAPASNCLTKPPPRPPRIRQSLSGYAPPLHNLLRPNDIRRSESFYSCHLFSRHAWRWRLTTSMACPGACSDVSGERGLSPSLAGGQEPHCRLD